MFELYCSVDTSNYPACGLCCAQDCRALNNYRKPETPKHWTRCTPKDLVSLRECPLPAFSPQLHRSAGQDSFESADCNSMLCSYMFAWWCSKCIDGNKEDCFVADEQLQHRGYRDVCNCSYQPRTQLF